MVSGKATVFLNVKRGKKGKERGVGGKEGEGTIMIQKEGRNERERERDKEWERMDFLFLPENQKWTLAMKEPFCNLEKRPPVTEDWNKAYLCPWWFLLSRTVHQFWTASSQISYYLRKKVTPLIVREEWPGLVTWLKEILTDKTPLYTSGVVGSYQSEKHHLLVSCTTTWPYSCQMLSMFWGFKD